MKKIIIFIGIGLLVAGCNLLGNQKPQQSLAMGQAYNTVSDLQQELVGAYNDLQYDVTNDRAVGGAEWSFYGSIIADNANYVGSYPSYQQIAQHAMDPTNVSTNDLWIGSYRVINDVNIILSKINTVTGPKTQAELNEIKGQCLFVRGSVYYYLAVYYGTPWVGGPSTTNSQLGVPVVTKPVTSSAEFTYPKRSTISDVYKQVKEDLTQASQLLQPTGPNGEGNKYAALGMLVRVAMQQHDYSTAASLANQIIQSGNYQLDSNIQDYFKNKFTKESIWEIVNTVQDNPGVNSSLPAIFNPQSRGDVTIRPGYMAAADSVVTPSQQAAITAAGDSVVDTRISELTATVKGQRYCMKYWDYQNNSDDAPILRYAGILLYDAEALARTSSGVSSQAIDLLNQVRERSLKVYSKSSGNEVDNKQFIDYKPSDFANAQALIKAILLERRVELAFEGERFLDLTRLGDNVVSKTGKSDAFDAGDLRFPVPQQEMDANPNLEQNPAYK